MVMGEDIFFDLMIVDTATSGLAQMSAAKVMEIAKKQYDLQKAEFNDE
jgi:hypothetical protein